MLEVDDLDVWLGERPAHHRILIEILLIRDVLIILVQVLASDRGGVVRADPAAVARARDVGGACTCARAARLLIGNSGVVVLGAD